MPAGPAARRRRKRESDAGTPHNSRVRRASCRGASIYNNRRSSVDCLVRDISDTGAKLVFGGTVNIPDVVELYLPNKDEVRRAKVQWRKGNEMGVDFNDDPADAGTASGDLSDASSSSNANALRSSV